MQSRPAIVLDAVLRAFKPLARLLLRHGVAYPAFASSLKQVFLEAAVEELQRAGKKQTDSAISLLSGVHRRDVRNLGRLDSERIAVDAPMNMASQVMSRWLTDPMYLDEDGQPLALARAEFDTLVTAISRDVRPRAVLDELARRGIAVEGGDGVHQMAALLGGNLHDHAAAAGANIEGEGNYLEQSIFVDELSADSVKQLHAVSAKAWRQAFKTVMREAQARFDHDRKNAAPAERVHRARFGAYYYACDDHERPS
jgi:hypothetical protein